MQRRQALRGFLKVMRISSQRKNRSYSLKYIKLHDYGHISNGKRTE